MQGKVATALSPCHEAEARSKLKPRFELFSQPLPTEAELFVMWVENDKVPTPVSGRREMTIRQSASKRSITDARRTARKSVVVLATDEIFLQSFLYGLVEP